MPAPQDFVEWLGRGDIIGTLLYQRGLQTPDQATHFLDDVYPGGLHSPFLMKDMDVASKRLAQAIVEREPIVVYGDFDTDGITAVSLLQQAITAMGGDIRPYIPNRHREGYGLNEQAIEQLAADNTRLLITVDCGISNVHEVARARALGLDVIVTDHHTPPDVLPDALAIVNPKQPGCSYPYKQLVGVGIAFKLVQCLFKQGVRTDIRGRDVLDLVALGTVADLGPLNGENRVLVKAGLQAINMTQRPGLQALIKVAGLKQGHVDSLAIGFMLAPRINAAGRLDDARLAYELLLTNDEATASQLADELNQANRQRQIITEDVFQAAREQAEASGKHTQRIVILPDESYPQGVVGLVAGKLVEALHRPVLLIERGETESRGSARSIEGFNMVQALTQCHDLFVRFGGHSMAAGFTIQSHRIAELEERLSEIANTHITDDMLTPLLHIDTEVTLNDLTWDVLHEINQLEPFGNANQQPVLMTRSVQAVEIRTVGAEAQHLKLRLSQNGSSPFEAVAFGLGYLAEPLRKHPCIDIAYTLEANEWNGTSSLQLKVKDFRRACKESG